MPLETATYISDLVVTNPANSDGLNQADDHMRLIKAAVKSTFPNFTAAALTSTQAQIDAAVASVVTNLGYVKPGFVMDFAGASVPAGWLECNGAAVSRTTYAALFTAIGTTWGAGDGTTTFNLPPDRYRVGRTAAGAAIGTLQASQNKTHTHTGSGATAGSNSDLNHLHTLGGITGSMNRSNPHSHPFSVTGALVGPSVLVGGGGSFFQPNTFNGNTSNTDINHEHALPANTGAMDRDINGHTHNYSFTTSGGSADGAEARPLTAVYLTCIKT